METQSKQHVVQAELERRILHGLGCEWEIAANILEPAHRKSIHRPLFSLKELETKWGYWSRDRNEICLSRKLVLNYPWESVRDVLRHEMAHQVAAKILGAPDSSPHGPQFQKACRLLRANPMATGTYRPLHDRIRNSGASSQDKILMRVKKLLALAESQNHYEAEAAMAKAHELIAKYNLEVIAHEVQRDFISIFAGKPALRHPREDYHLANLLRDFYFVRGIWISAFVLPKNKMGRVLEISGILHNVQIASYVYNFIKQFIHGQWSEYNQSKRLNRYRLTDFAVGIIEGFRSKLDLQGSKSSRAHRDLALVKTEDPLLEQYLAFKYPHTVTVRKVVSTQDETVLKDGRRAGKRLVIAKGITDNTTGRIRLIKM
jgi:hypothetical protein